jgi:hypothetical protein
MKENIQEAVSGIPPEERWRATSKLPVKRGECRLAEGKPIASTLHVVSKYLTLTAVHWSKAHGANSRHNQKAAKAALTAVKRNESEVYVDASGRI